MVVRDRWRECQQKNKGETNPYCKKIILVLLPPTPLYIVFFSGIVGEDRSPDQVIDIECKRKEKMCVLLYILYNIFIERFICIIITHIYTVY